MTGLILAAPSSGSGKTTITLGLLRALYDRSITVRGAKSGPDYIDPRFHEAACHAPCFNLDAWAMTTDRIRSLACGPELLLIEGAMGLFDGAPPDGKGATADLVRMLKLPVVLVVDASHMAQSVTALVSGFSTHDPQVRVAGIILNKVGSPRHETMLRRALAPLAIPVLGAIHRDPALATPSRHLGLVQAREHPDLQAFLEKAAAAVAAAIDLEALRALAAPLPDRIEDTTPIPKAVKRVAIAGDAAFNFTYPHLFLDLAMAGYRVIPFSPLADEPVPEADLIFLPGGYPELHAERLANATTFIESLRNASEHTEIYGECGGYMVLGETLIDADGTEHRMAGLLSLQTSFAQRKLHLGYRHLIAEHGPFKGHNEGHEFHYATTVKAEGEPLFQAQDAEGNDLPPMGLREGLVCGSFGHIIEPDLP